MSRRVSDEDFYMRDVVSVDDFSIDEIMYILDVAGEMVPYAKGERKTRCMEGRIMSTVFFEPSTRTRLSHEAAMLRLGGSIMAMGDIKGTSVKKGESLSDTIRMMDAYSDVIVLRHPGEGAARLAADLAQHPVINAGDGAGQHPTQTLLDLFTIRSEMGKIKGLNVVLLGDLKYGRTVHSLAKALARFGANLIFVSPPSLQMPIHIKVELADLGCDIKEYHRIEDAIGDAQVLYVTRIQKERFPDPTEYAKVANAYRITPELLKNARDDLIIMHPLPRVNEISPDVDGTKHARYFVQAFNGVPTRMALLSLILGVRP